MWRWMQQEQQHTLITNFFCILLTFLFLFQFPVIELVDQVSIGCVAVWRLVERRGTRQLGLCEVSGGFDYDNDEIFDMHVDYNV